VGCSRRKGRNRSDQGTSASFRRLLQSGSKGGSRGVAGNPCRILFRQDHFDPFTGGKKNAGKLAAPFWQAYAEAGPAIQVEIPAGLPLVDADAERLGQVLRNLLTNARRHTPPEGEVAVSARQVESEVQVAVKDTGSGIAPEHLPYVFERFYRADPARARADGGAGLGLAIVKQLVAAHGGQVWVESQPGHGATFTFTLPVAGEG